jgi:ATP-dependent DNA helicase RecG
MEDHDRFKKLGFTNLLDLSLHVPIAYEKNLLGHNTFEITITSVQKTPRVFRFHFITKDSGRRMVGILFNTSYFHIKHFIVGAELFIKGKIEHGEVHQPKIIKREDVNKIIPKYAKNASNKTIKALVEKYISVDTLMESGLPQEVAEHLYRIHHPTPAFIAAYEQKGFSGKLLESLKYTELYNYTTKLSKKRRDFPTQQPLCGDVETFINSLPFQLTNDQLSAISDIQKDFLSEHAAKRVIVGDVGCGKTMVILCSVMLAHPHRAILMAPTTILAKQIYEEAQKYLPDSIKSTLVTNKTKKIDLESYDFIIGTHALLYKELPPSPLIMIDEQHRFGTNQRELIKTLVEVDDEKRPHFLQFSATPIPRTFSMLQSKTIDFSFIKELPFTKDIDTRIVTKQGFSDVLTHIEKEIQQNHQIIIVYPLVESSEHLEYQSIDEAAGFWQKKFDNVYVTHGKDKEKEQILEEFRDNGSILLATTVIEVGISLPRLTTIVIAAPERLGLASLHQLRGRVSRNGLKGYCYLFTKIDPPKRLKDFIKTTNGFEIAELDLKYRQSGDLLEGKMQSGKSFRWVDFAEDEELIRSLTK